MSFSQSFQINHNATRVVYSVSTTLNRDRNLKRLVQKFKKSSELYRFRTKTAVYEDTVRRLAAAKRFELIEDILEDQKKYSDYSKEGFAVRLISLYGKSGMFENARKVFDEMPLRNCPRTVLSFNALLAACVHAKRFELVGDVFREVPLELSIEPDLISYNTVIKSLCETGSLGSAVAVFGEIDEKGLNPDVVSFNTLLNGFYSRGRLEDGDSAWALMEKKLVVPDVRSYNAKLYGLVLVKQVREAVDLIGEMRSKGIDPDSFSFNLVIQGFIKDDNLEGAKLWYREMKEGRIVPTRATFEKLIPFFRRKGSLELVFELTQEVFARKVNLDTPVLQRVVDELVKASMVEEAEALVELGKSNNYRRYRLKLPEKV